MTKILDDLFMAFLAAQLLYDWAMFVRFKVCLREYVKTTFTHMVLFLHKPTHLYVYCITPIFTVLPFNLVLLFFLCM